MFENIITFIDQLLQNTINLINDLLTANAIINPEEAVEAVTSLLLALMQEITELLNSILPRFAPCFQAQINTVTEGLRHSVAAFIHIISEQESGINLGNVQGLVAAIQEFCTNVCDDLIAALDSIFNPPTPCF